MLAEASLKEGDQGTALQYMNLIRERAYEIQIIIFQLPLDDVLDERSRSLAWEATRRTRFN